jgi:hypothetical protein
VAFSCVRDFSGPGNGGILVGINNCPAFLGSAVFTQCCGALIGVLQKFSEIIRFSILLGVFSLLCLVSSAGVAWFNRRAVRSKTVS